MIILVLFTYRPDCRYDKWIEDGGKFCSKDDPNTYGGYYTQEEIKEIIKYAEDRFITIIPEISMADNCHPVIECFPKLGCTSPDANNLCMINEDALEFLQDVLKEIM